jgi:delta-1-pyrroline-5-carboxylate synthetase
LPPQGKAADSLLQRLGLKPAKIQILAEGIRAISRQDEPIGRLTSRLEVAEGKCSYIGTVI